jgi:hypothetical protein
MTAEITRGSLTDPAGWWPAPAVPAGWWLALALAVGVWYGRRWLKGHPVMLARRAAIAEAEEWEARKAWWHSYAPSIGLHGTHLLDYAETLLGAGLLIDTVGTGLRASQINTGEVEELIAEREGLARGRIDVFVNPHERAGRLHIRIRRGDPWKHPFPHPAVRPGADFAELVPFPATCTEPLAIGVDPETGDALPLTAWQPGQGGKVILVVGSRGAGKTVLMNCITERLTACADAAVVQVNLYKHREDAQWAPACALSVLGSDKLAYARRALKWVVDEIEARSLEGDEAVITPRRDYPLIVVKIDEYPSVKADPECRKMVEKIAQACRSEAVCLIVAAQTARAEDIGARLRALIDTLVIGRFDKEAEARRAADGLRVPDLSLYGGEAAGVWAVCTRDRHWLGRSFLFESPPLIAATARARSQRGVPRPPMRTPGQEWLWRQADGSLALEPIWDDESDGSQDNGHALAGAGEPRALTAVRDGPLLPDGGGDGGSGQGSRPAELRARIGGILEHTTGTGGGDPPDVPADVRERMRQMTAERHQQALAELTDVDIPPHMAVALLALICDPDGISSRDAARVLLGGEKGRMTAFRWLQKFEVMGLAEVRGKGSKRRFHATDKGQQAHAKAAGGDTD